MSLYKLARTEVHAIALNRLADIDRLIAEGDSDADWPAERIHQVRLVRRIERKIARSAK